MGLWTRCKFVRFTIIHFKSYYKCEVSYKGRFKMWTNWSYTRLTFGCKLNTWPWNPKTTARTVISTPKHFKLTIKGQNTKKRLWMAVSHRESPPLTMKFIRWKTFCVVHPYSGTLNSILISWNCAPQAQSLNLAPFHKFFYKKQVEF